MNIGYGKRFIILDEFVKYCSQLKVKTCKEELEYYEQIGIMFPLARIVYPEDYIVFKTLRMRGELKEKPIQENWSEIKRLFDRPLLSEKDYASLSDEELIDSFDREMGQNPYLFRPAPENYKPWAEYEISIHGHQMKSVAENYYGYWQVHQLYYIQEYSNPYGKNLFWSYISNETKQRVFRPRVPDYQVLHHFDGMTHTFDALSFWIRVYHREHERTFAFVPAMHQVKHLDESQAQSHQKRLITYAESVQRRYNLTVDQLFHFLYQLLELSREYQDNECYKLSEEIRSDCFYHAQFIGLVTDLDWEAIIDELTRRHGRGIASRFRRLDVVVKERDEAREVLNHFTKRYGDVLGQLKITNPSHVFPVNEIDDFLDYLEQKGPSVLLTALSGMVATDDEYSTKFRRVNRYINLKNALVSLEFLLKDLVPKTIAPEGDMLFSILEKVMKTKSWGSLLKKKRPPRPKSSTEFASSLNSILDDPDLVESEDAYWARVFLIAYLARNLTVHNYPSDDRFYGELYDEMVIASVYAIMYFWQLARQKGWA